MNEPDDALAENRRLRAEVERLTLENATLRDDERRFRTFIERATDVLYVVDAELVVRFWSPGAERALGWTTEQALGRHGPDLIHPDDRAGIVTPEVEGHGELLTTSFRVLHRDGEYRVLDAIVRNLLGEPSVRGIVVNARDVTEQRLLAQRSAESKKLESLGRLAGGVAHDFNNLLTVILTCGELIRERSAEGAVAEAEDLEPLLGAASKARELTRQLLAFARREEVVREILVVDDALRADEALLRRVLGGGVELVLGLRAAGATVRCDAAQLHQLVVNLILNARDARPTGRIELTTDLVTLDEQQVRRMPGLTPGPHLRLRVHDDGPGLSEEVRARLFEPFFTTKAPGQGTGLGLSTVYGIATRSGGTVSVDSGPGRGTTFDVHLPRREPAGAARR